jgi:mono/diheme cytochrome c family protein
VQCTRVAIFGLLPSGIMISSKLAQKRKITVMRISTVLVAFSAFAAATAVQAQESGGDVQRGRQLALGVCASCHAVRAGQTRPPLSTAPSFQEIADTPGMTSIALSIWLNAQSHPTMPNFVLSSQQVRDVSAYILSLRQ